MRLVQETFSRWTKMSVSPRLISDQIIRLPFPANVKIALPGGFSYETNFFNVRDGDLRE
jgi:hypothetical protein